MSYSDGIEHPSKNKNHSRRNGVNTQMGIIDQITKCIIDTNGATIQGWELFQGNRGFVVGCGNIETITVNGRQEIWHIVEKHYMENVGFWMDEGKLYIDRIQIVDDVKRAISLANDNNELAIWDIANQQEIRTNNNSSIEL